LQPVLPDYCNWSERDKALFLEDTLTNTIPGLERELCHKFFEGELHHWVRLTLPPLIPPGTKLVDLANLLNVDPSVLTNAINRGEITFPLFLALLRLLNIQFDDLPHRPRDVASVIAGLGEAITRAASRLQLFTTRGLRLADLTEDPLSRSDRALLYALVCDTAHQEKWITIAAACCCNLPDLLTNRAFQALLHEVLSAAVRITATDDHASTQLLRWTQPDPSNQSFAIHLIKLWNDYYMPTELAREMARLLVLDDFDN
jgi:hypothetical protein